MTPENESKNVTPSIKLTEDRGEGQGQTRWNGNYGKYLAQHLRTQGMARSRSTTLDPISLVKIGNLLLKCTAIIGTETKLSKRRCDECIVLTGVDGDAL